MASTMSRVSLNGTVSGVGRIRPCSNATPEKSRELFIVNSLQRYIWGSETADISSVVLAMINVYELNCFTVDQ